MPVPLGRLGIPGITGIPGAHGYPGHCGYPAGYAQEACPHGAPHIPSYAR
jgi:hypothetical protein